MDEKEKDQNMTGNGWVHTADGDNRNLEEQIKKHGIIRMGESIHSGKHMVRTNIC